MTPLTESAVAALLLVCDRRSLAADLVVPAFEPDRVRARLRELAGDASRLAAVESIPQYLDTGHDWAILASDDPADRARAVAEILTMDEGEGHTEDLRAPMSPSAVVDWLARNNPFEPAEPTTGPPTTGPAVEPRAVRVDGRLVVVGRPWGGQVVPGDGGAVRGYLAATVGPGDTAVDVGANVGLLALQMADLVGSTGSVIAIEADPATYGLLQRNIDAAHLNDVVHAVGVAAYSQHTTVTIHDNVVPARPLDELLPDHPVRLLRIGVRGSARRVLDGATAAITDGRVQRLLVGTARRRLGEEWVPFCELLDWYRRHLGASYATLDGRGVPEPRSLDEAIRHEDDLQLVIMFSSSTP